MTQATTAFKMPYQEKQAETFVSFRKQHENKDIKNKKVIFERLLTKDSKTQNVAVLGYD